MLFGSDMDKVAKLVNKKNCDKLAEFVDNKDKNVCLAAIRGMGQTGEESALGYLSRLLTSKESDVRIAAAEALGSLGFDRGITFLIRAIENEDDPAVKEAMRSALDKLHHHGE